MNPKKKKKEVQPEIKKELEETKNRLLRCLADFDNFKKRAIVEKEQFIKFANENLIKELLPVVDNFGRAMAAANKIEGNDEMKTGLSLVKKQIEDVLKKHGAQAIEALGKPYDPNFHEAIMQKEDEGPEGIVLEEINKGYTLNKRLIRPAMVIVSKKLIINND